VWDEMKVYLSPTFEDLEVHRRHAYRALRSLGLDVVAMEYVARDERPGELCLNDVADVGLPPQPDLRLPHVAGWGCPSAGR
jgi:hypothetical protein